jgi:Holliday junction resolvase
MAANKSRDKGLRAENALKKILADSTGLGWERTPKSGGMHARYKMKGDLFIPNTTNMYLIECKHYKDDSLSSNILTNKNANLIDWWDKAQEQAIETGMSPMVIYKWDRSKWYVLTHHRFKINPNLVLDTGAGKLAHIYPLTKLLEEDIKWVQ